MGSLSIKVGEEMKKIIILKWDSMILGITSIIYGLTLYVNPDILKTYQLYQIIDKIFDNHSVSIAFMVLGTIKLIGVIRNSRLLKRVSIIGLTAFWSIFSVSFMMTPPTNTVWIYVFNSYEYVQQDGNGVNNYHTDIDGDLENGTKN